LRTDESTLKAYDLVVDVTHPKGRKVLFRPAGDELLRSEITQDMIPGKHPNQAIRLIGGKLPGMRLYMDTKNGSCKILDKLTLDESSGIVEAMRRLAATEDYMNTKIPERIRDKDFGVPRTEMYEWMFWIRRLVDEKKFTVIKGTVPSIKEIFAKAPNGEIIVSDDAGLKPNNKGDQPFNVVTIDDFPEAVGAGHGK